MGDIHGMPMLSMNAVIYSRVSSRDQVDGTSLESQEAACRAYADRHDLTVVKVFVEEGESAKAADRPKLLEMLAFCRDKTNAVQVVLVWKVDRFARNVEDHYSIKATLRRVDVKVVSVTERIDGGPNGKLMETILAGFAQFDNDIRAVRSVQGMQRRIQEGIWPWHPPLGYVPPKLGKKTEPDRPDPDRFAILQKAWQLYATGGYTKADVVSVLRERGVTGYCGRRISPQTLDKIFRNPYYAGELRDPWSGETFLGRHTPMVSKADFARVQVIGDGNANAMPHHRANADFPLRGLVRCPSCQAHLTAAWSRGRRQRYAYYSCFRRGCLARSRGYRAAEVHEEFTGFVRALSAPPRRAAQIASRIRLLAEAEATQAAVIGTKSQATRKDLERQLQDLIAMRLTHTITDIEFAVERERVRKLIAECDVRIASGNQLPLTEAETAVMIRAFGRLDYYWRQLGSNSILLPAGYTFGGIRTAETALLFRVTAPSQDPESNWAAPKPKFLNTLIEQIRAFLQIIELDSAAEVDAT